MPRNLVAKATTSIHAARQSVWKALTSPDAIKQYMFGADVESDWRQGSPITWRGEWKGKRYEDKGVILNIDEGRELRFTHFSPLSGRPDVPENYHTVTIDLSGAGDTTKVALTQDGNADVKSQRESQQNWEKMLSALKSVVEARNADGRAPYGGPAFAASGSGSQADPARDKP